MNISDIEFKESGLISRQRLSRYSVTSSSGAKLTDLEIAFNILLKVIQFVKATFFKDGQFKVSIFIVIINAKQIVRFVKEVVKEIKSL